MEVNKEMFQAIQEILPTVFGGGSNVLSMRQARPRIESALSNRGFEPAELHKEIYRHIHQSSINVLRPRSAYKGVRKILWNDDNRTFRLLNKSELADIAASRPSPSLLGHKGSDLMAKSKARARLIARESLVRDYVANNLSALEPGMKLFESNAPAVEYLIENRRIDILARDASLVPVIIELKLHRAHDRVVGQALLYRALIRRYQGLTVFGSF
jgi:hypothetical protein